MNNKHKQPRILSTFYLAYFIRCKVIKRWKKLAKKSRNRYLKLREWRDTEENYLGRLRILKN